MHMRMISSQSMLE